MLAEGYRDLWDTHPKRAALVGRGQEPAQNGDYYWVLAVVRRCCGTGSRWANVSVRTVPTRDQVAARRRCTPVCRTRPARPPRIRLRAGSGAGCRA